MRITRVTVYDNPASTIASHRTMEWRGEELDSIEANGPSLTLRLKNGSVVQFHGLPYRINRTEG